MKPIYLLLSGWVLLSSANPVFNASPGKEPTGLTPVYTIPCPVSNVNFHSRSSFGFTTQGILAINNDHTTLGCYDFDGKVLWQRQPPEKVISAMSVSGDGSKIIAHKPLSEDAAMVEVMTADDEETLVTVDQSGFIRLFEMKSGQILLERDIGATFSNELSHVTWSLSVSADGKIFTVAGRSGLSNRVLIQTYDRHLTLLWMKEKAPGNYETPVGISENGRLLCITNPVSLIAYDNTSGNLLWQLNERILNNNPLVTNRFIAMAQIGHELHVFITAKDGNLLKHFTTKSLFFESRLPFLLTPEGKINLTTDRSDVSIIEIKKENGACAIVYHRLE